MREFYNNTKSYFSGYLKVSDVHEIYYEESGNPKGLPVVFLHGGPGSAMGDIARGFFDPKKYRIIIFHQRGCGLSKPFSSLYENTTFDLIQDMEKIRKKLNIDKWIVFGGSWGSTLALCYAINHPERVESLILRGIFLGRQEDIDWLFKEGASYFFPEDWDKYLELLTEEERKDPVNSYMKYLNSDNLEISKKYCKRWSDWEMSCVSLLPLEKNSEITEKDISMAKIECHYFTNSCFFEEDNYILNNISKISDLKVKIVHGRYDVDCRPIGAYLLHKNLKNSELIIVDASGHSSLEPGIKDALVRIMDEY